VAQGGLGDGDSEGHMASPRKQAYLGAKWASIWTLAGERRRGTGVRDGRSTAPRQMSFAKDTVFVAWCEAGRGGLSVGLRVCTVVWRPTQGEQERHGVQDGIWRPS